MIDDVLRRNWSTLHSARQISPCGILPKRLDCQAKDPRNALAGVRDMLNQPLEDEPRCLWDDLQTLSAD
jgi:hypothetical protein